MKIKSDLTWAVLLIGTAAISFYLGTRTGTLETEGTLKREVEESTEKITVLENKIDQLSEELRSRGIYSYPQANVVSEKNDDTATVVINLNGKDAIPDLEIERRLITDYSGNADGNFEELENKGKTTHIGTLSAHNPVAFDIEKFQEELAMDLIFKSERNSWHQYIRARKNEQGEIKTFWIITNGGSEVIDKHIDEGFPTDDEGNIILGKNKKMKYSDIKMNSVFQPDFTD